MNSNTVVTWHTNEEIVLSLSSFLNWLDSIQVIGGVVRWNSLDWFAFYIAELVDIGRNIHQVTTQG